MVVKSLLILYSVLDDLYKYKIKNISCAQYYIIRFFFLLCKKYQKTNCNVYLITYVYTGVYENKPFVSIIII